MIGRVQLRSGEDVPALGLGTWRMGENRRRSRAEADALRLGLDLGMTLIDTAEMYGEGGAEEVVAEAIAGRRAEVFLVSKVYPHNASREGTVAACERSLKRLRTDCIDLYLLHWRGTVPVAETVAAFERLRDDGKIRHWGVSNLDTADMKELARVAGGGHCAANQLYYNLARRGIEWELAGWCRKHAVAIMAYSPVDQGRLATNRALREIGRRHGATAAQIALAWLLSRNNVIVIPKASDPEHVRENRAAADLRLTPTDLAEIERAFPPPAASAPLEMT